MGAGGRGCSGRRGCPSVKAPQWFRGRRLEKAPGHHLAAERQREEQNRMSCDAGEVWTECTALVDSVSINFYGESRGRALEGLSKVTLWYALF